jgi:hypothetical protein
MKQIKEIIDFGEKSIDWFIHQPPALIAGEVVILMGFAIMPYLVKEALKQNKRVKKCVERQEEIYCKIAGQLGITRDDVNIIRWNALPTVRKYGIDIISGVCDLYQSYSKEK